VGKGLCAGETTNRSGLEKKGGQFARGWELTRDFENGSIKVVEVNLMGKNLRYRGGDLGKKLPRAGGHARFGGNMKKNTSFENHVSGRGRQTT